MDEIIILPNTDNAVVSAIDEAHERMHANDWRNSRGYLETSSAGNSCSRWIWFRYHRAFHETFPGRLYRLYRRGHREEETIVADLNLAGIKTEHTGDANQVEVVSGCLKGHLDGIILGGVPEAPKEKMVLEMKSYNQKRFQTLEAVGVQKSDPKYFCQCQIYMRLAGLNRCLFVAVNKNDDEMHVERLELDKQYADGMIQRAKWAACSDRPPLRLSDKPDWWECKLCACHDLCHGSKTIAPDCVTCRTCAHVTALEDGTWKCELWNHVLSFEEQMQERPCHTVHPDLVDATLDDQHSTDATACYVKDGKTWMNGIEGIASKDFLGDVRSMGNGR